MPIKYWTVTDYNDSCVDTNAALLFAMIDNTYFTLLTAVVKMWNVCKSLDTVACLSITATGLHSND